MPYFRRVANPAVAFARTFTDTFIGSRPVDLPDFRGAELAGAPIAAGLGGWLFAAGKEKPPA